MGHICKFTVGSRKILGTLQHMAVRMNGKRRKNCDVGKDSCKLVKFWLILIEGYRIQKSSRILNVFHLSSKKKIVFELAL